MAYYNLANSTTATSPFKQIQRDLWKLRVSQMFQFQILQLPDGGTLRGEVSDPHLGLMLMRHLAGHTGGL